MPLLRALVTAVVALSACTVDLPDEPARAPEPAPAVPGGTTIVVVPGDAADPGAAPAPVVPAGAFTAVSAEGAVEVDVTVGAPGPTRIACGAKQAAKIHVEAQGDVLHIWTERGFHEKRGRACTVYVGLASLRALDASGPGNVHVHGRADGLAAVHASGPGNVDVEEMAADAARLDVSGPGDVTVGRLRARSVAIDTSGPGNVRVAGTGERVRIACSGPSDVDARGLAALDVEVSTSGPGSVEANAARRAIVSASGPGSVTIAGRPAERRTERSGPGSIAFE